MEFKLVPADGLLCFTTEDGDGAPEVEPGSLARPAELVGGWDSNHWTNWNSAKQGVHPEAGP
jgi:hypothetical protein